VTTSGRAPLPRAALLVLWGNAHLRGGAALDDAAAHVTGLDALHRVVGVPGDPDPVGVGVALGRLRTAGVEALRLVLPEPGDATGLPGPTSFTADAVAAGQVAIAVGPPGSPSLALLPTSASSDHGDVVRWDVVDVLQTAHPYGLPTLSEAERSLAETMTEATEALAALDLARGRDDVAGRLRALEQSVSRMELPASLPPRAQRSVVGAARLLGILEVAAGSPSAAVTAAETAARDATLRPLRRAVRHALCAAASAEAEPARPDPGSRAWRTGG
jgi:hypothetical protein